MGAGQSLVLVRRDRPTRAARPSFLGVLCGAVIALATAGTVDPARAAATATAPHIRATLETEAVAVPAEGPFWAGVWLEMDPGWHVYWRHPGDSGLAPSLTWTLPAGMHASEIAWPVPHRISAGPLANYGYEHEVLLPVEIRGGARKPGSTFDLVVRASWLVCQENCIPGEASLSLSLPVVAGQPASSAVASSFAAVRAAQPRTGADLGLRLDAFATDSGVTLQVEPGAAHPLPAGPVEFFTAEGGTIAHAAPQPVARDGGRLSLRVQPAPERTAPLDRLHGVLVAAAGWGGDGVAPVLSVDVPVGTAPPVAPVEDGASAFLAALAFAALGGLLLNLMPCVFPVLSIKILDFVEQAGGNARAARRHGMAYGAGVVVSMWVLAGVLLAFRATGAQLGWGFQLQSPAFVLVLAALLLALAANLLGAFEIGIRMTGVAGNVKTGAGTSGAFVTGVLAVVVATPCTAPFMGTALAYALTLPAVPSLLVFTALGVGMALPYVLLCAFPGWLRWLPRPGAWLETLKQAMAFPLLGAVVWLVWVLAQQTGPDGVLPALSVLLAVGFAAWLTGRGERLVYPRPRALVRSAAAAIAVLAVGAGVRVTARSAPSVQAASGVWSPFSPDALAGHRAAGQPVFVDFTAAWCLTCQVNERLVLDTAEIQARFAALGVTLMRADWTNQDPTIARTLEDHGRAGVPLYILYGRDPAAPPIVLPAVLTRGIVLDALDQLTARKELT